MKLGDKDITLKLGDKDVTVALGDVIVYSPVDPNSPKVSFYSGNGEEEPWELLHESYFPTGVIPDEYFRGYDHNYPEGTRRVDIGSGITEIGDSAFMECGDFGVLNIGKDVVTIGEEAFMECVSLEKINSYRSTAPSLLGNYTFDNAGYGEGELHVPQDQTGYSAWISQLSGDWTLDNDLPATGNINPEEPDPGFGGEGGEAD